MQTCSWTIYIYHIHIPPIFGKLPQIHWFLHFITFSLSFHYFSLNRMIRFLRFSAKSICVLIHVFFFSLGWLKDWLMNASQVWLPGQGSGISLDRTFGSLCPPTFQLYLAFSVARASLRMLDIQPAAASWRSWSGDPTISSKSCHTPRRREKKKTINPEA